MGIVSGGQDAVILSFGTVHSSVTADRDAVVFALGTVISTNVTGGRYASLVTWGGAVPLINVDGDEGALVWAYGDINGQISSLNGAAVAMSLGDISNTTLSAGTHAVAFSLDGFTGSVSATESVEIVSLGDISANVTAGGDVILVSEGTVNSNASAGKDLLVAAEGNINGNYTAFRDAAAVTHGEFNARLQTGRDVIAVAAVGNVQGVISADRNVSDVFSWAQVTAAIFAGSPTGSANGGQIASVSAIGDVGGTFIAETSIDSVVSGASVTSTLIAPTTATPVENDTDIITDNPLPQLPASSRAAILADADLVRDEMFADYDTLAAQLDALDADVRQARTDTGASLAESRADLQQSVAETRADAVDALVTVKDATNKLLSEQRVEAEAAFDEFEQSVAVDAQEFKKLRDAAVLAADQAADEAQELLSQAEKDLLQQDGVVHNLRMQHKTTSIVNRTHRDEWWKAELRTVGETIALVGAGIGDGIVVAWDIITSPEYWSNVGQTFLGYWDAGVNLAGGFIDLVTTNPWTTVKNVAYAAYHYDQTWDAIVADYEKKAGTARGRGEIVGDVLIAAASGGFSKGARETARVSKFANRIRKANKLVDASPSRRILDNPFGMTDDFRLRARSESPNVRALGSIAPNDFPTVDGRIRITATNGDDIVLGVKNGVANVEVSFLNHFKHPDLLRAAVKEAKDAGATKLIVNSGPLVTQASRELMENTVQNGKPFMGQQFKKLADGTYEIDLSHLLQ